MLEHQVRYGEKRTNRLASHRCSCGRHSSFALCRPGACRFNGQRRVAACLLQKARKTSMQYADDRGNAAISSCPLIDTPRSAVREVSLYSGSYSVLHQQSHVAQLRGNLFEPSKLRMVIDSRWLRKFKFFTMSGQLQARTAVQLQVCARDLIVGLQHHLAARTLETL